MSEFIFMTWMLLDELKLKYLSMPLYIPVGFIWLVLALIVKLVIKKDILALVMVVIPGIPLAIMAAFIIVVYIIQFSGGTIRWN